MVDKIKLRLQEIAEAMRNGGLRNVIGKRVFFNKTVMPVEMDLLDLPETGGSQTNTDYEFIHLSPEIAEGKQWRFTVKSRQLKAVCNLREGLRGFGFKNGERIVADIWCACPETPDTRVSHADLDWLGIKNQAGEVYAFDMFIDPEERGNNLAAPFQKSTLYALKAEGYKKVYGYYWTDYLPALWMHRLLKWRERGAVRVWRIFSMRRSAKV